MNLDTDVRSPSTTAWLPACTQCGRAVASGLRLWGTDLAPTRSPSALGKSVQCEGCGCVSRIGDATVWITV